jgi:D-alanyl-D-alanine dipeptidase
MEVNGATYKYEGVHLPIPAYKNHGDPRLVKVGDSNSLMAMSEKFFQTEVVYNSLPLTKRNGLFLRTEVIQKLIEVESSLPANFKLVIYDGHRTMGFQKELLDYYNNLYPELQDGYVSKPNDSLLVPPHTTGGAVDLTLSFKNKPLELGTPYDSFEDAAHIDYLESTDMAEGEESQLRRLLYHSMIAQGFAPYPLEWWHWSYGDQWWATFYGKSESLFPEVKI